MSEGRKISRMIYTGLIALSAIVLLFTFWARFQRERNNAKPTIFGYMPTVVVSGSMAPALEVNSINIIKDCASYEITAGDIIVFWSDLIQGNVIHRVVEVKTENGMRKFKTKGDNNPAADPGYVTEDMLIGKVVFIANWMVPVMERVMKEDGSGVDYGRAVAIVFPVMIVIWSALCVVCFLLQKLLMKVCDVVLCQIAYK